MITSALLQSLSTSAIRCGGTRVALDFPATHAEPPTDTSAEESLHV